MWNCDFREGRIEVDTNDVRALLGGGPLGSFYTSKFGIGIQVRYMSIGRRKGQMKNIDWIFVCGSLN